MKEKELHKKQNKCKHDVDNGVHSSRSLIKCPKCQFDITKEYWDKFTYNRQTR